MVVPMPKLSAAEVELLKAVHAGALTELGFDGYIRRGGFVFITLTDKGRAALAEAEREEGE